MLKINPDIPNTDIAAPPAYPYGSTRNDVVPGDNSGTPFIDTYVNDIYYALYAVLGQAGVVPSSNEDTATTSDFLDAVNIIVGGNISTVAITASVTLTAADLNKTFEIDLTLGNITITLPLSTSWETGNSLKFRIVNQGPNGDNRFRVSGNGGELISSFAFHSFYFTGTWVTVKKYISTLVIDDYNDAKSTIFQGYYANGDTNFVALGGTVIYPSIDPIIGNEGSFYNSASGVATLRIPGQWDFHSSIYSAAGPGTIAADLVHHSTGGVVVINSSDRRQWTNSTPMADTTSTFSTNINTDTIRTINVEGFGTVGHNSQIIAGFSGKLIKRFI